MTGSFDATSLAYNQQTKLALWYLEMHPKHPLLDHSQIHQNWVLAKGGCQRITMYVIEEMIWKVLAIWPPIGFLSKLQSESSNQSPVQGWRVDVHIVMSLCYECPRVTTVWWSIWLNLMKMCTCPMKLQLYCEKFAFFLWKVFFWNFNWEFWCFCYFSLEYPDIFARGICQLTVTFIQMSTFFFLGFVLHQIEDG